jgi:hypothetical protein
MQPGGLQIVGALLNPVTRITMHWTSHAVLPDRLVQGRWIAKHKTLQPNGYTSTVQTQALHRIPQFRFLKPRDALFEQRNMDCGHSPTPRVSVSVSALYYR